MTPALLLFALAQSSLPSPRPVVAVFDVETNDVGITRPVLESLSEYLGARLASGGFQLVPRAELRERLRQEKAESYRPCYDERCQIEIGREVAAEKSVATRVLRIGETCQVTSVMFDLRNATSEAAATAEARCIEPSLLEAIRTVADRLTAPPMAIQSAPAWTPPAAAAPSTTVSLEEPSTTARIFTCPRGASVPAFLGWCTDGTVIAPVHAGSILYASAAKNMVGLVQVGVVTHDGGSFYGLAQGGVVNVVEDDFYGVVQASAVNVVLDDFVGAVQGGAFNHVGGSVYGVQVGVVNDATRVRGVQVGLLNIARNLRGLQLGLVNVAENGLAGVLPIFNVGF